MIAVLASLIVAFQTGQVPPDKVFHRWAKVKWVAAADAPFLPIRNEMKAARAAVKTFEFSGKLPRRADALIQAYKKRPNDAVLLYRASATYLTARSIDYTYDTGSITGWRMNVLMKGWEEIDSPPSYEFARMGYGMVAGWPQDVDLMPLADRLLKRNPVDDLVVPGFVMEVYNRGYDRARCVQAIQLAKAYQARHPEWAAPHALISTGYVARFMKYREKADIDAAIRHYDDYLARVPKGFPSLKGARDWRAILAKWQKAGKPV